jgi:hypothetical protein
MRGSQKREDDRRKNDEKEAELLQLGLWWSEEVYR